MSKKLLNFLGNEVGANEAIRIAKLYCSDDYLYKSLRNVSHPSTLRHIISSDLIPYDGIYKAMRVIKSNCIGMLSDDNLIEGQYFDEDTFYDDLTKCIQVSSKFMIAYERARTKSIENEANNAKK